MLEWHGLGFRVSWDDIHAMLWVGELESLIGSIPVF